MGLPINKVLPAIEKIVDELGYILYDIESDKLGSNEVLRVLVLRSDLDSVDIDDCVKITHGLTPTLDNDPSLSSEYMLEVASPGIIRNLSKDFHFKQVIGQQIEVKTFKKLEGQSEKKIIDKLVDFNDQELVLESITISRSDIAKATTTFEF